LGKKGEKKGLKNPRLPQNPVEKNPVSKSRENPCVFGFKTRPKLKRNPSAPKTHRATTQVKCVPKNLCCANPSLLNPFA